MFQNGWVFWIIIGATVVQWIFGKLREQAELTRAKQGREKRRVDNLRTGQGGSAGASTVSRSAPTITQHDLQARREAQLKALRDRQRALGQSQTASTPAPPRTTPRPAPSASAQASSFPTTSSRPVPQQRSLPTPQTSRQAAVAAQRAARAKQIRLNRQRHLQQQQQKQQAKAQAQAAQSSSAGDLRISKPKKSRISAPKQSRIAAPKLSRIAAPKQSRISQRALLEQREIRPTTTSNLHGERDGGSLAPRTLDDWRRAIIASEILAPPVSMREME